jgi:hypothetical protein
MFPPYGMAMAKKWIGMVMWWINKFIIPNLDYCSGDL